jgi:hypothetical protein
MKKYLFCFFQILLITHQQKLCSQIAVGTWRDHLPYYNATAVVSSGDKIFCSSPYATFYYNPGDQSINKLSCANGLSDIGISTINYDSQTSQLMVAYDNANIDIIKGTDIYNLSDIKNKQILGDKKIYQIIFKDKLAYLACGFGIVVIDLEKKEVKETYYIGPNASAMGVLSIAFDDMYIYAATGSGIYRALKNNPNLVDYTQWQMLNNLPNQNGKYTYLINYNSDIYTCLFNSFDSTSTIYRQTMGNWEEFYSPHKKINNLKIFDNKLYVVELKAISIFNSARILEQQITNYGFGDFNPNDIYLTSGGNMYIADKTLGLVQKGISSGYQSFIPNGPYTNHVGDINAQNNQVVIVGGGHSSFGSNFYNVGELYTFSSESWVSKLMWGDISAQDFSIAMINPYNPTQIFVGGWGGGVFLFENGQLSANYNTQNSTLQTILPGYYVRIGGMVMDQDQNLYITNVGVQKPISVKTVNGNWYGYNYLDLPTGVDVGEIIATQSGSKWVLLRGGGIFVFNDNATFSNLNDDLHRKFSIIDETGQFITNQVFSIAEDDNGTIWVGTDQGVFTYYNPENIFANDGYLASRVKVVDKDHTDVVQYLLAKEKIQAIAIDGANRKWFGTENSGVFLLSDDCENEIFHFTKENSKLLSNNVSSIAIDPKTGEVFFGTDKGVESFKSTATKGNDAYTGAYVYPNPVRENYDGLITITGLASNVNVKITDIAGQIVYETKAFGGQAIWNGKTFSGKRVNTGVYLVFCTDDAGKKKKVLKLLFIN